MTTVSDIQKEYAGKLDHLDFELLIAHALKKTREFVLAHPEFPLAKNQESRIKNLIGRRMKHEPLAYIVGHKEFFGLDFKVTPDTLIPRPETELLVELAIQETKNKKRDTSIIDVGTGSGNIIISLAKNLSARNNFIAIDISKKALQVARKNAKANQISEKIKFIHGSLLSPLISDKKFIIHNSEFIILANLPYLSKEIYSATLPDVKKYEPRSALYSPQEGLDHYEKLLKQISALQKCYMFHATCYMEISPEQKIKLPKIIKKHLPQAEAEFVKDLAHKWRVCKITIPRKDFST